jgi:hypothetical protein
LLAVATALLLAGLVSAGSVGAQAARSSVSSAVLAAHPGAASSALASTHSRALRLLRSAAARRGAAAGPGSCVTNPQQPAPGVKLPPKPAGFFPLATWGVVTAGPIHESSPTVADALVPSAGGALVPETIAVFGDEAGEVYVVNAATCEVLPGWPRLMSAPAGTHAAIESTPALAWFQGPRQAPTVIVGAGSTWVRSPVGEVEAFDLSARLLWKFVVHPTPGNNNGVFSSPAVGPVVPHTGDDVVFGSWDYYLYVLDSTGQVLAKYYNAETIWSSPALYRLPGRSTDDVFVGLDKSQTNRGGCIGGFFVELRYGRVPADQIGLGYPGGTTNPKARAQAPRTGLYVVNQSACQGASKPGAHGQAVWSSPAIGDLDGWLVAAVGTSFYDQPYGPGTDDLYVYPVVALSAVPSALVDHPHSVGDFEWQPLWIGETRGPVLGSPAIGDLAGPDGSTVPALVDTSFVCTDGPVPGTASAGVLTDRQPRQTFTRCSDEKFSDVDAWTPPAASGSTGATGASGSTGATGASGSSYAAQTPLRLLWTQQLNGPDDLGSPVLVPLLGEEGNDVLVGAGGGMYPLSGANGSFLYQTQTADVLLSIHSSCIMFNTPAVADVLGPGPYTGWYVFQTCDIGLSSTTGGFYAFPLPKAPGSPPAWPMFRGFADHDAVAWSTLPATELPSGFSGPSGVSGATGVSGASGATRASA